jgi:hypothetical protein
LEERLKVEDVLDALENSLNEAEAALADTALSASERLEARGARKAYAHCVGLVKAVLEAKGWT